MCRRVLYFLRFTAPGALTLLLLPLARWLVWVGKSTVVSNLIFGARHSLATQSEAGGFTPGCTHDDNRNHSVNVHGCGIGWYSLRPGSGLVDAYGLSSYERPAIYRTTAAPSHDRNLRSLAKMIETGLLFGHVRAAGPGASVHEVRPARGARRSRLMTLLSASPLRGAVQLPPVHVRPLPLHAQRQRARLHQDPARAAGAAARLPLRVALRHNRL